MEHNTQQPKFDFVEVSKRRAPFTYIEGQDTAEYRLLIEFMIIATLMNNENLTKNQIAGLFRNCYRIPEELTKATVDRLLKVQTTEDATQTVLHMYRIPIRKVPQNITVEYIKVTPQITDREALNELYKDHCNIDLTLFQPETYIKLT